MSDYFASIFWISIVAIVVLTIIENRFTFSKPGLWVHSIITGASVTLTIRFLFMDLTAAGITQVTKLIDTGCFALMISLLVTSPLDYQSRNMARPLVVRQRLHHISTALKALSLPVFIMLTYMAYRLDTGR